MPFAAAGSVSDALNFYEMISTKGQTNQIASATEYAGTWSINLTNDTLTYSVAGAPVPLPPSVWLMVSGLAGVAFLGRRRKAAVAA